LFDGVSKPMNRKSVSNEPAQLLRVVTGVVEVAALYVARTVFIPLALASLLSELLAPAIVFLERIRLPRLLAVFVAVLALCSIAGGLLWRGSLEVAEFSESTASL
jgi:predicted PurR-regulated permease PerM